jgi:hypothetical protein
VFHLFLFWFTFIILFLLFFCFTFIIIIFSSFSVFLTCLTDVGQA